MCGDSRAREEGITCCGEAVPGIQPPVPHFLCFECFCGYILTSCGDQSIETEIKNRHALPNSEAARGVSPHGTLPCIFFRTGDCTDGQIEESKIFSALSQQGQESGANKAYLAAMGRVAVERYRRDEEQRQAKMERAGPLERARMQVEEALRYGQAVPCPGCHILTRKDDACMHMTCTQCRVQFCYVCGIDRFRVYPAGDGQPRAADKIPCGCDTPSFFLENHPGWGNYGKNNESAAYGALMEFHRLRMARFVRLVKQRMDAQTWNSLRRQYPNILKDVIGGRSIMWEELDTAEHPQFGIGMAREKLRDLEEQLMTRLFSSSVTRPRP